jgi:peptidoglycan/LPS O-acetylase OafA/YrhL
MIEFTASGTRPGKARALPIDHLRAALILLVVVHHAVLAYHAYAPSPTGAWDAPPMMWRAFPVVDAAKAPGADLLVGFNDVFFMTLLFFLAGLFTWSGLKRKGAANYLRDRGRRLGLPFVVCAGVLAPLAYFPSYLQHGGTAALAPFWKTWTHLGVWPAGPAWFLWVLLAFSVLAALSFRLAPGWGDALGRFLGPLGERPWTFFALLVGASAVAYMPMAYVFDPMVWSELGPFTVQTSRVLHYALYFVLGIGVGAYGLGGGLFAREGRVARSWALWQGVAVVAFIGLMACVIVIFMQLGKGMMPSLALRTAANFGFSVSCAASSLMFLSFFVRYGHWAGKVWRSLDRNAYGIYLVHYVFTGWLQYSLLEVSMPGIAKAATVSIVAILLSWGTSILLRRIPGVARVV